MHRRFVFRRLAPVGRLSLAVAAALTFAALAAAPVHAQSLTGTWTITSEGRGGPVDRTLVLALEGSALTGTITLPAFGRRGGGGGGGGGAALAPVAISEGSVNGNAFSFAMTVDVQGNTFTQRFTGTFEGDAMQGQIEGGRGGAQPFTGRRGS